MAPKPQDPVERFLKHVEKVPDGCWLWTGATFDNGYGAFRLGDKQIRAHRFAYEAFVGPIPDGHLVLHECDIRRCVRPDHLFTGTQKVNIADMIAKGRQPDYSTNAASKLDDDKVREIRQRVADGETQQRVADSFGVTQSLVSQIVSRRKWAHVV